MALEAYFDWSNVILVITWLVFVELLVSSCIFQANDVFQSLTHVQTCITLQETVKIVGQSSNA